MKKVFFWFIVISFLASADVIAQVKIKSDTLKTITLSPKESKAIKSLISTDTAYNTGDILLQTEILKFNPNLIYKYRLDSISSEIPLDYNPYVQSYIDVFTTKRKGEMGKMLGLGQYYFPIFEKALAAYKVPKEFKYLPIIESSMNPMAVSKSGAAGLWQFMYTTGKVYGLTIDSFVDERRDPIAASYAAAKYLRDAYDEFGDWLLALAAYNSGGGTVRRVLVKGGIRPTFWDIQELLPAQTRTYVPAFIAANYMMTYYDKHDVKILEEADIKTDSVYVNKFVSFQKIAQSLNMDASDLQSLNPSYKKNIINGTLDSPKRLIIPKVATRNFINFFEALNADEPFAMETPKVVNAALMPDKEKEPKTTNTAHIVKKGENLTIIANLYLVEVQDLKVWNKLESTQIAVGQKLVVNKAGTKEVEKKKVEPKYFTYQVKAGDTLTEIAERFENVTINSLKILNDLKSSLLTVGAVLKIYQL